ncbi:MAG: HutD family protein [Betaproteobacteria bacterium]
MIARHDLRTLPALAWKNGGGTTREIARRPAGASLDDFDWRVSVATIAADGAFSAFTGVDRWIVLMRGGGVRLTGAGIDHRLDVPHVAFAFDGATPLHAALLDGESADFNVMSRRGRVHARFSVLRDAARLDIAGAGVVHAACGTWTLAGDARCAGDLVEGEGIGWDGENAIAMRATPRTTTAVLYVVDVVSGNRAGIT